MRPSHQGARNPYTQVTYHKGYVKDQIKHQVLAVDHLKKTEREAVRSFTKPILTGDQAEQMVYRADPLSGKKGFEHGWSYKKQDLLGRVGILSFRGTEVVVFVKRQMTEVIPEPGEPLPEGILAEPTDVWMRFDLMGRSAREQNLFLAQRHSKFEETVATQQEEITAKESLISAVETENQRLTNRVEWLEKRVERLTAEKEAKNGQGRKGVAARAEGTGKGKGLQATKKVGKKSKDDVRRRRVDGSKGRGKQPKAKAQSKGKKR